MGLLEKFVYDFASTLTGMTVDTTSDKTQAITGVTGSLKRLFQNIDNFLQDLRIRIWLAHVPYASKEDNIAIVIFFSLKYVVHVTAAPLE